MEDMQTTMSSQDRETENLTASDLFIEVFDHEDYLVKYCN